MKFYTWCNNSKSDKIQRLLDSAKLQNIEIETIGGGRDIHEGGNYNGKNLWLYEKVCELDENEIVVCTDSFDVTIQRLDSKCKCRRNKTKVSQNEYSNYIFYGI